MSDPRQADATVTGVQAVQRPLLLYDGDCPLCSMWARRCAEADPHSIECVALQQGAARVPRIPASELRAAVHLVAPDGTTWRGAHALLRAAALSHRWRWPLRAYGRLPGFARASEAAYRFLARHRRVLSRFTRQTL